MLHWELRLVLLFLDAKRWLFQGVSHAAFSPLGGDNIVSTSFDDTIRIWKDWSASSSCLQIKHNNNTGRWISPFRTTWDATGSLVVVGSPYLLPLRAHSRTNIPSITTDMTRAVDIFDSKSGKQLYSMVNGTPSRSPCPEYDSHSILTHTSQN
jgi:hypothetical protein